MNTRDALLLASWKIEDIAYAKQCYDSVPGKCEYVTARLKEPRCPFYTICRVIHGNKKK